MLFKNRAANEVGVEGAVLLLQVPRTNEKKELAAEQLFASLHGLLMGGTKKKSYREHLSFEIAVQNRRIGFYVWVPEYLKISRGSN